MPFIMLHAAMLDDYLPPSATLSAPMPASDAGCYVAGDDTARYAVRRRLRFSVYLRISPRLYRGRDVLSSISQLSLAGFRRATCRCHAEQAAFDGDAASMISARRCRASFRASHAFVFDIGRRLPPRYARRLSRYAGISAPPPLDMPAIFHA